MSQELATLKINVDAKDAVRETERLGASLGQVTKQAGHAEDQTASLSRELLAGASSALTVTAGLAALAKATQKVVAESSEAQFAQAQLRAALRSTGNASGQTIASLNKQAAALQGLTIYSDDAVASAQSILLTFTNLSGDVFPRATVAVANLAARMGGDLSGAAMQVGKALNDPTEGLGALSRAGVQFSAAQQETIKTLAETNRMAEAQAIILAELETKLGGSAAAARNTLGGALAGLTNAWNDLFGASEGASRAMIGGLTLASTAVSHLGDGLSRAVELVSRIPAVGGAMVQMARAAGGILGSFAPEGAADVTFTSLGGPLPTNPNAARDARRAAWEQARREAEERKQWETEAIVRANTLAAARFAAEYPNGPRAPGASATSLGWMGERMRGIVEGRGFGLADLPDAIRNVNRGQLTPAQAQAKMDAQAMLDAEKDALEERKQITENYLRGTQAAFADAFRTIFSGGKDAYKQFLDGFKNAVIGTAAELASRNLMNAIFGRAGAGGLGGLASNPLVAGLAVGGAILGSIFGGRSRGPSYRANATPRYEMNGTDERQAAAREWLAEQSRRGDVGAQVRQSVGNLVTETSAMRLVGEATSARVLLTEIRDLLRAGAAGGPTVTINGAPSSAAQSAAALVDRALGLRTQQLRLASGAGVIG